MYVEFLNRGQFFKVLLSHTNIEFTIQKIKQVKFLDEKNPYNFWEFIVCCKSLPKCIYAYLVRQI